MMHGQKNIKIGVSSLHSAYSTQLIVTLRH